MLPLPPVFCNPVWALKVVPLTLHSTSWCYRAQDTLRVRPVANNIPKGVPQSPIWSMHCAQAFNEAGVAFEPFHLKKEREEGYFDSDGNYIQYKLDEVKDAWLDSLADGTFLLLPLAVSSVVIDMLLLFQFLNIASCSSHGMCQ